MKLVREHINEIFTEDSDPVHDMGIGLINQIQKTVKKRYDKDRFNLCVASDNMPYIDNLSLEYMLTSCIYHHEKLFTKFLLTQEKIDVNFSDSIAFRWACQWGNLEIIKLFIEKGANINAKLNNDSPLACAVYKDHFGIVKYLTNNGAKDFRNAIEHIGESKPNAEKIKIYLEEQLSKEKVNEKFKQDSDPIHDLGIGRITWENLKEGDILKTKIDVELYPTEIHSNKLRPTFILRPFPLTGGWMYTQIVPKDKLIKITEVVRTPEHEDDIFINFVICVDEQFMKFGEGEYEGMLESKMFKKLFKPVNKWELKDLKESINEKFELDTDPVEDLRIGWITVAFKCEARYDRFDKKFNYYIDYEFIPKLITSGFTIFLHEHKIKAKVVEPKNKNSKVADWVFTGAKKDIKEFLKIHFQLSDEEIKEKIEQGYTVNEKFIEDSDPIQDMGIGVQHYVKKTIEKIAKEQGNTSLTQKEYDNIDDLLWISAWLKRIDLVKLILKMNVDVHKYRDRALRWAIYNHDLKMTKLLLDARSYLIDDHYLKWALKDNEEYPEMKKVIEDHIKSRKIKESLNEKFVEDSDPIHDMNIGIYVHKKFSNREKMYEWLSNHLQVILDVGRPLDDILKDILNNPGKRGSYLGPKYTNKLFKYAEKYLSLHDGDTGILPNPFHHFLKKKFPHIKSWMIEGGYKYP
jgi:hypothetical protein